jgi:hypothetical protein
MLPTANEVVAALQGAIRLARLDPGGLSFFDRSLGGFWRSFFAAVLTAPVQAFLLISTLDVPDETGGLRILVVETISYAISWLIFPFVMLFAVDMLNRRARYFDYLVPYNWSNVPQAMLVLMATGVASLVPSLRDLLWIIVVVVTLIYEWFIAKTSLMISGTAATALALFDFALGLSLNEVTKALLQP